MKDFFTEYGFVIIAAIVVVSLITITNAAGKKIKTDILSLVGDFTTNAAAIVDDADWDGVNTL